MKEVREGGTHRPRGWGRALPPGHAPLPRGPPGGPPMAIFCYMESFDEEKKIISHLLGRNSAATRRNLGGINLGLRRSCSAGDTSLREGEIIVIIITNNSPIFGRAISINIFNNAITSQILVHLLCSIFVPEP